MPRRKAATPAYRYHVSGQARVYLDGRHYYLGEYESPESKARYHALLRDYHANGMSIPDSMSTHQIDHPITIAVITAEFREEIKSRYANNRTEASRFANLCDLLNDEYGDEPAAEFGPRKLAEIRDLFVASGNCRKYANQQTRNVVRIFRHAVSRELIKPEQLVGLESLEPLRRGQTTAPEGKPREPAELDAVKLTAKYLSPTLRAMVRIQAATGMRPSEIFRMRPCDIDQTGEVWVYRPADHKTANWGKNKAVPIVGDARDALTPFMHRNADTFCFSPRESKRWYQQQRTANRVTPESFGNIVGSNRRINPKRRPGEKYTKDSYNRAIRRACDKAGVKRWTPYQLRHMTATAIRESLDLEAAKALLGHSTSAMTEHYAKQSLNKAIAAASVAPVVGS